MAGESSLCAFIFVVLSLAVIVFAILQSGVGWVANLNVGFSLLLIVGIASAITATLILVGIMTQCFYEKFYDQDSSQPVEPNKEGYDVL